jgi:hypothetical protein
MSYGDYQKYLRDKELSIANKSGLVWPCTLDQMSMEYTRMLENTTPLLLER